MDWPTLLLLFAAGVGAGIVGSTAGLASLISYPALLAVGLPPVTANMTNTVSLLGSGIGSVAGSLPEYRGEGRYLRLMIPTAFVSGGAGAALLLLSPPGSFALVVPVLVLAASVLMLSSTAIRRAGLRRQAARLAAGGAAPPNGGPLLFVVSVLACLYGGYFGAAAGVMIMASQLSMTDRTVPVANAMKNLLLLVANVVSSLTFMVIGAVAWSAVVPTLLGALVGGRIGPVVVRRVPPTPYRWTVGLAGIGLAVHLAVQAW